jgi:hypothetical protein
MATRHKSPLLIYGYLTMLPELFAGIFASVAGVAGRAA